MPKKNHCPDFALMHKSNSPKPLREQSLDSILAIAYSLAMRRETLQRYFPLVAGLLLAIYGSAGVLGYGLHSLWGCGHCHHEASMECAKLSGEFSVLFSNHADKNEDQSQLLLAQEDCPICSFLLQAQSKFVLTIASECVDSIPTIPPGEVSCYVAPLLATHPGRGPPNC